MDRLQDYNKVLPVIELYTAIQAEGSRAGRPTVVIRTTGCTHRCWFGDGGWCDSWYSSIHPEKGTYTFNDIIKIYKENPEITEMMLTGGSPTMHKTLINELTHFAAANDIVITLETEGSHFVETDHPIDLVSISPKFSNSIPSLGIKTPLGKKVTQQMINQHNKHRLNLPAIKKMIETHISYQIKPVWDGEDMRVLEEILEVVELLKVPKSRVWFMPAGDTREALMESYPKVINWVKDNGYRFTGRPHIIAFDTERNV